MSRSYTDETGQRLIVPNAYAKIVPGVAAGAVAVFGIVAFVGEADSGPHFSQEEVDPADPDAGDPFQNAFFAPDADSDVVGKYGGGPLVDLYRACAAASNDAAAPNAPQAFLFVKTNRGTRAFGTLAAFGGGKWADIFATFVGTAGGKVGFQVDAAAIEVAPTTGQFSWVPPSGALDGVIRVSGGPGMAVHITAGTVPSQLQLLLDSLVGLHCTGGGLRALVAGPLPKVAVVTLGGLRASFEASAPWGEVPKIGDSVWIPSGSSLEGPGKKNKGGWLVQAVGPDSFTASKFSDDGGTPGTVTPPEPVASATLGAAADLQAYAPLALSIASSDPLPGVGKALEIAELTTSPDRLGNAARALDGSRAAWVSRFGGPVLLTSAVEYATRLTWGTPSSGVEDSVTAGGDVVLQLGYRGTTAVAVKAGGKLTLTVAGGAGKSIPLVLSDYPTVGDIVNFLNAQPGYSAATPTLVTSLRSPLDLDEGTYGFCSTFGATPGQIKADAAALFAQVVGANGFIQIGDPPAKPQSGLPAPQAFTYLAGGQRGSSSTQDFAAAFAAIEDVYVNFVGAAVSRDAADDIVDGITDPASTYKVEDVHQLGRVHCENTSKYKAGQPRIYSAGVQAPFLVQRQIAARLASATGRVTMAIQSVRVTYPNGNRLVPPHVAGLMANSILAGNPGTGNVGKSLNVTGSVATGGGYRPNKMDDQETALQSGIMPLAKDPTTGWYIVADQTTWRKDTSFYYNSAWTLYVGDLVRFNTTRYLAKLLRGSPLADFVPGQVEGAVAEYWDGLRKLKWLSPSAEAPPGYRNVKASLVGGVAVRVDGEIFLNGPILFVPITLVVKPVTG